MTIPTPIRSVFRMATGLLLLLVVGAWQLVSVDAGFGVLMGGVVMLLSFAFGGFTVRRVSQAAEAGMTGGASGLAMVKLPALVMALWMLLERFDPISVVIGGSVVTIAVVLQASFETLSTVPEEAR